MICSDIDPYSRKSIIRLYCIVNGIIVDNMATIYILCMKETGRQVSMLRQQERTLGSRVLEGIGASRLVSLTLRYNSEQIMGRHDDVIKWKHFPRNWPFVRGIHRSSVNSLRKGQWRGALMFSLICVWINDWVNNREAGDLRRYLAHYDVIVMEEYWLRAICVKNFHIAAKFDRRQGSTAAAEPSLSLLLTTLTVCPILYLFHNSDVIMSPMASQITSLSCDSALGWMLNYLVDIGSCNDMVLSGNKPLPGPMLAQIDVTIECRWPQWVNQILMNVWYAIHPGWPNDIPLGLFYQ